MTIPEMIRCRADTGWLTRTAGRNHGLGGLWFVLQILSGLEIGRACAWRTSIAAELVFGTRSGQGGLGWFIFQSRNELLTVKVFAGLAALIIIGLAVENIVLQTLERVTIHVGDWSAKACHSTTAWAQEPTRYTLRTSAPPNSSPHCTILSPSSTPDRGTFSFHFFILTKMVQRSKVFLTLCTPEALPSARPAHKACSV